MSIRLNGATSGSIEIDVPADVGSDLSIELPATGGGQFIVSDSAGDVNIDSGTLFVDASTDRVGIGTASPSYLLHCNAATDAVALIQGTTFSQLFLGDASSGTGSYAGYLQYNHSNDSLAIGTNSAERMRISSNGSLFFEKTSDVFANDGLSLRPGSDDHWTKTNTNIVAFRRNSSDGHLIQFYQDGTQEGNISVSGTTVSYNGAHLSRWSQLTGIDPYDKTVRPEILRGTVMSNLDEMCDWTCPTSGDCQDNEQLNKTKISDVEGDKNVAGVFQTWDDEDDTWVNDYYLAMTGDFVIRIAPGTTVERGDLLMSAGDGTAKPQEDDIIRSKTIAKVTSTNVSCTYDDGSYCVPCVLMAC